MVEYLFAEQDTRVRFPLPASENTTTYAGTNYVIFQNVTRTEVHEYWAMARRGWPRPRG